MPKSERIDLQARAVKAAGKTHPWPAGVPEIADPAQRERAGTIWRAYLKSRGHDDWAASDLHLLAEAVRLSVAILECHERIEIDGALIEQPPSGRIVQHPAVQALSNLTAARGSLLTKLKIATTQDADPRPLANQAKREANAPDPASDVFGEALQ